MGQQAPRRVWHISIHHRGTFNPNSWRLNPNSRRLNPNSRRLNPNSRRLNPNSRRLNPNTRRLNPNFRRLNPVVARHARRGGRVDKKTCGLKPGECNKCMPSKLARQKEREGNREREIETGRVGEGTEPSESQRDTEVRRVRKSQRKRGVGHQEIQRVGGRMCHCRGGQ